MSDLSDYEDDSNEQRHSQYRRGQLRGEAEVAANMAEARSQEEQRRKNHLAQAKCQDWTLTKVYRDFLNYRKESTDSRDCMIWGLHSV